MGNKLRDFQGFRETMLISIIFSFLAYYFFLFYANLIRTFVSKNIFSPRIFFYSSFYFFSNSKRYFFFLNTGPRFSSQDSSTVVPTWIVDRVYTFLRNPPRFSCTGFFFFFSFILLAPYLKCSKITSTTLPTSISLGSVFRFSPERLFPFFSRLRAARTSAKSELSHDPSSSHFSPLYIILVQENNPFTLATRDPRIDISIRNSSPRKAIRPTRNLEALAAHWALRQREWSQEWSAEGVRRVTLAVDSACAESPLSLSLSLHP